MEPHAWPIVCVNQMTGSVSPLPAYEGLEESSESRLACQAGVMGMMTRRARTGRGMWARSSGSVKLHTS